MHYLTTSFYRQGKRILIIDTVNSLNLHHVFFNDIHQESYFRDICCVRTPLPYDLWARLGTAGSFIKKRGINVLLITSLSLLFKDSPKHEVIPMVKNILHRIDYLTKKYQLITIIANSIIDNESTIIASQLLSQEKNVVEVKA